MDVDMMARSEGGNLATTAVTGGAEVEHEWEGKEEGSGLLLLNF